jgi:type II secretory pathway pseudopilin PulG
MNSDRIPPLRAFTFIGLLVILAVLAILAAMLLPALARAKARAQRIQCTNNLKQTGLAFRTWSLDHNDQFPMAVSTNQQGSLEWVDGGNAFRHFRVLSKELPSPKVLVCASDTRTEASDFSHLANRNLSYFVALDARDTAPQMLLTGDRNITNGSSPKNTVLELSADRPAGWTERMHQLQGNVGLADGSVQQFTNLRLQGLFRNSDSSPTRIALPQ